MTDQHPITPPWALIAKWRKEWTTNTSDRLHQCNYVANHAARWGADQELEACCEWLVAHGWFGSSNSGALCTLRAARRPKPQSLAEQGLMALEDGDLGPGASLTPVEVCIIRRALERLQELEGTNG